MARTASRAGSERAKSRAARAKKPYTVLMEPVKVQKRPLRTMLSFTIQPPQQYIYIAAGEPEFTKYCKELCRKRGKLVHVVSENLRGQHDPDKVSHNVHRMGHHFPEEVVRKTCAWFGCALMRDGRIRFRAQHVANALRAHNGKARDQQIHDAIVDLFPNIPEHNLAAIIEHTWKKAQSRTGGPSLSESDLPLTRKVQLAVGAHIRHELTAYDSLLEAKVPWLEARRLCEPGCVAVMRKWRNEDGADAQETEEVYREVIDLVDDDDYDDDDEEGHMDIDEEGSVLTSVVESPRSVQPNSPDHAFSERRNLPQSYAWPPDHAPRQLATPRLMQHAAASGEGARLRQYPLAPAESAATGSGRHVTRAHPTNQLRTNDAPARPATRTQQVPHRRVAPVVDLTVDLNQSQISTLGFMVPRNTRATPEYSPEIINPSYGYMPAPFYRPVLPSYHPDSLKGNRHRETNHLPVPPLLKSALWMWDEQRNLAPSDVPIPSIEELFRRHDAEVVDLTDSPPPQNRIPSGPAAKKGAQRRKVNHPDQIPEAQTIELDY
ncbi:hypothetical protein K402DRAFT_395134 [Aulographum hederae CBS 113979]|uniref:DUF2293 domain-containing protein n=1 Tax=Aulographum hederae CBS 113979 TaxID=1176131 RepID=A0A6G1GVU6_9PEZI|nr:hypothetical protein K402DRAFT_395134 [Aulographum hederae CBS 113979]